MLAVTASKEIVSMKECKLCGADIDQDAVLDVLRRIKNGSWWCLEYKLGDVVVGKAELGWINEDDHLRRPVDKMVVTFEVCKSCLIRLELKERVLQ